MKNSKDKEKKFFTSSGVEEDEFYTPDDLPDFDPLKELGLPGDYPFTRGIHPTMYRGKLWTMRQYAGFGTAEESNRRYRFLLSQGQTGLSVAFDLPTQVGLDSDHPQSQGEIGKVGVAIDSVEDMVTLFDSIPLEKVSVSMTINATAAAILAMYLVLAREKGVPWEMLSGTIQNDVLKEYVARGTYIYPPQASLKITTDILSFCHRHVPRWNTMSISGYHIREAGATAVQELAFTLANAITYVEAALDVGLDVDSFAPRLSFFFASHNNFFEEIAKFRAGRRIWARIMRETYKAKNPLSWKFRFHTQTSGATLLAQQPNNNITRVTLQAMAAVLGGTQSLHTNSRDEALALPSEESAQLALRTQQIIAFESGVVNTPDPLGGTYFVEKLTCQIEELVLQSLQKIREMGGMLKAIEEGIIQREIQESAYAYQKRIEKKDQIIVGLNEFLKEDEKVQFKLLRISRQVEKSQVAKLKKLREKRSADAVDRALNALRNAARGGENLMPLIIEAVEARATLGEVSSVLSEVFGVYREAVSL